MNGDHDQASIEQPLDQQPVRTLDRDELDLESGQPCAQAAQTILGVPVATTLNDPAGLINYTDSVLLAGPIHPSEPALRHHRRSLRSVCTQIGARYPGRCLLTALRRRDLLLLLYGHLDGTSGGAGLKLAL